MSKRCYCGNICADSAPICINCGREFGRSGYVNNSPMKCGHFEGTGAIVVRDGFGYPLRQGMQNM